MPHSLGYRREKQQHVAIWVETRNDGFQKFKYPLLI